MLSLCLNKIVDLKKLLDWAVAVTVAEAGAVVAEVRRHKILADMSPKRLCLCSGCSHLTKSYFVDCLFYLCH